MLCRHSGFNAQRTRTLAQPQPSTISAGFSFTYDLVAFPIGSKGVHSSVTAQIRLDFRLAPEKHRVNGILRTLRPLRGQSSTTVTQMCSSLEASTRWSWCFVWAWVSCDNTPHPFQRVPQWMPNRDTFVCFPAKWRDPRTPVKCTRLVWRWELTPPKTPQRSQAFPKIWSRLQVTRPPWTTPCSETRRRERGIMNKKCPPSELCNFPNNRISTTPSNLTSKTRVSASVSRCSTWTVAVLAWITSLCMIVTNCSNACNRPSANMLSIPQNQQPSVPPLTTSCDQTYSATLLINKQNVLTSFLFSLEIR